MRLSVFLFLLFLASCASERKQKFIKEKTCSPQSLKYLRNPRNINKEPLQSTALVQQMAGTYASMQQCYDEFKERTGAEEFDTCLVVGVDELGQREYFNFSSNEKNLDQAFLECAHAVTKHVPFESYGKNYILIQSYQFYVNQ